LAVGLACALIILTAASVPRAWRLFGARSTRNNVLLITVDLLRADYVSCYGGKAKTPHIDALAAAGVKFANAASAAPWTRPSFGSIHLSVYPTVHGVGARGIRASRHETNALPSRLTTLAEAFRDAGYVTQAFVCNTHLDRTFGFDRGYDDYCMYEDVGGRASGITLAEAADPGRLAARRAFYLSQFRFVGHADRKTDRSVGERWGQLGPSGAFLTGAAMRWLRRGGRPFFVWIHYMDLHQYLNNEFHIARRGAEYRGLVGLKRLVATTAVSGRSEHTGLVMSGEDVEQVKDDLIERYLHNLLYVDALVGCVLSDLDALGIADRTHVVLTSDHGEEFGEHGDIAHGHTLYEELLHVPLIVRSPSVGSSGATFPNVCSLIDLAPTLLDLTGTSVPSTFAGRSLLPIVKDEEIDSRDVFSEFIYTPRDERKALRSGYMKLISAGGGNAPELYDLRADPLEQHSMTETKPPEFALLRERLRAWMWEEMAISKETRRGAEDRATIDERMRRRLRSLGYSD